jgi:membrane protein DedA with SNARE-associated domain
MRYRTFLLYNAMAAVSWAVVTLLLGFFAGASWRIVEKWIGRGGLIIGLLGTVLVLGFLFFRKRRPDGEDGGK